MTAPDRCQNCAYASKYSKQEKGEIPAFCKSHEFWLCAACRESMGCNAAGHPITGIKTRGDVTGIPVNDGIYSSIDDVTYHSDLQSLSSSGARALLNGTPEEFDFNRRRPSDPNKNYDFGHAAHKMVLGIGSRLGMLDPNVCGHTADGKLAKVPSATSEWKLAAAKHRREGKLPIAKADMEKAQTMAGKVFQHPIAKQLLGVEGQAEHSIYWHDDATGVRLRIRPDYLPKGLSRQLCIDYKTADSADPRAFQRAVASYGYHQQQAFYEDGLIELGFDDVGFLFVVQSKTAPYAVSVCQIEPEVVELGRRLNRVAIELFASCQESGKWPGYDGLNNVGMAGWAKKEAEALLESHTGAPLDTPGPI